MFTQQTQIPRSPFTSLFTVALYTGVAVVAVALTAVPSVPVATPRERITFVTAAALPELTVPPPKPVVTETPEPRVEVPQPASTAMEAAVVRPALVPEVSKPVPKAFEEATPAPPVMRKPALELGAFADAAVVSRRPDPVALAESGFESATSAAVRSRREIVAVDGFDASATAARTNARTLGVAGFSSGDPGKSPASPPRTASAAGFGAEPPSTSAAPAARTSVASVDFADSQASTTARPATPAGPPDRQVEITFKPTPAYTDEARERHVEGEVSLEVEFTADGRVRVLRIVRGLGYGLDDMARRAAEQIRFKPATNRGTPVDVRTHLTIVFRLT